VVLELEPRPRIFQESVLSLSCIAVSDHGCRESGIQVTIIPPSSLLVPASVSVSGPPKALHTVEDLVFHLGFGDLGPLSLQIPSALLPPMPHGERQSSAPSETLDWILVDFYLIGLLL
jgi:hypothetical protein